jgi:transcriptional regulator with XRE-family HTH domain
MNGACDVSTGELVAFYRRRRGLTQQTLAGLVGRTPSWVEKIENGRAPLDRISVVRDLARALGVSFRDLVPEDAPVAVDAAVHLTLDYRSVNPRLAVSERDVPTVGGVELRRLVDDVWRAYQDSRWGYVVLRLNQGLPTAYAASQNAAFVAGAYVHPRWQRKVSKALWVVVGLVLAKPLTMIVLGATFGVICHASPG